MKKVFEFATIKGKGILRGLIILGFTYIFFKDYNSSNFLSIDAFVRLTMIGVISYQTLIIDDKSSLERSIFGLLSFILRRDFYHHKKVEKGDGDNKVIEEETFSIGKRKE